MVNKDKGKKKVVKKDTEFNIFKRLMEERSEIDTNKCQ